ncbi:MAG: hypothetical protein ACT4PU_08280 [Planctomycetota bacterium]
MLCRQAFALVWAGVFLLGSAPAAGAGVIVVNAAGGGDFATVQAAIDAASPLDVILLRAASFNPTTPTFDEALVIDGKGLVVQIQAAVPVSVRSLTVRNISLAQTVVVRGLRLASAAGPALEVDNCLGSVRVEECELTGGGGAPAALVTESSGCALLRCQAQGGSAAGSGDGSPALDVQTSRVTVHGGEYRGGGAVLGQGGSGVHNAGGTLHAGAASFFGGDGANGGAALLQSGSPAKTTLQGGGYDGGAALAPLGVDGRPKLILAGSLTEYGEMPTFDTEGPIVEGGRGALTISALPGDHLHFWGSLNPADLPFPNFQGTLLVSPGAFSTLLPIAITPPSGTFVSGFTAPALSPAAEHLTLHLHLLVLRDGATVMGGASVVVILDSAF